MKTLERHFRWALGEKPAAKLFWQKLNQLCTRVEVAATVNAAANLVDHHRGHDFDTSTEDICYCLERYGQAFADFALALCRATEAMHESVPKGDPKTVHVPTPVDLAGLSFEDRIHAISTRASPLMRRLVPTPPTMQAQPARWWHIDAPAGPHGLAYTRAG